MSDVTTRCATPRGTRTMAQPGPVQPPGMAASVC